MLRHMPPSVARLAQAHAHGVPALGAPDPFRDTGPPGLRDPNLHPRDASRVRPLALALEANDRALHGLARTSDAEPEPLPVALAHAPWLDPQPELRVRRPGVTRVLQHELHVAVGRLAG